MSKFLNICPKCLSSQVRTKIGGGGFVENGFVRIADDFGELYCCPSCDFAGADIIQGNMAMLSFLKSQKALPKIEKKAVAEETRVSVVSK